MSRAARRRDGRQGSGRSQGTFNKAPIFIMGGSVLAALLVVALVAGPRGNGADPTGHHPTPRIDVHTMHTMPAARYASLPGVPEVYEMAAQIPEILDGIYCYCLCHDTFGHYSLLDCFMSDHAAECDVCLKEAIMAYQMNQQGQSLSQIRQSVDQQYRT
jgi:hypothetical protein